MGREKEIRALGVKVSLLSKDCMPCGGKRVFTSNRLHQNWYNELRGYVIWRLHKLTPTHKKNFKMWEAK